MPKLRQVMWISHCGKPVCVCDGSDSDDCWSVGILPVLENVFMEDVMIISIIHHLSILCSRGSAQAPRVPPTRLPRNTLHLLFSSFASALLTRSLLTSAQGQRSLSTMGVRSLYSSHLCFLHLLAGFAVRLTTTHPFVSIK